MSRKWYLVAQIIQIFVMVVILLWVQVSYGLLLAITVFVIFIIYSSLVFDVKAFGSFFERDISSILVNDVTIRVIDFLLLNIKEGQSIPSPSLYRELSRQKNFPEFLFQRVLQDLEQQGIIRVELNEFSQKIVSLKDGSPYDTLILW